MSHYEEMSVMVDGILFGRVKKGFNDISVSPRTNPSSFSGLKHSISNSTTMSGEAKALLLKRIELYEGITQPLYSPAIH